MFIVEKPFVSDLFRKTVTDCNIPVVDTAVARELGFGSEANFLSPKEAVKARLSGQGTPIYSNSENAIGWVAEHLSDTSLPGQLEVYKNKALFREKCRSLYPDFFFKEVPVESIPDLDVSDFPFPFVIKPNTGFFSHGVYKVSTPGDWNITVQKIRSELQYIESMYPKEVLDAKSYIIEESIEGDEFAIDGYIDSQGNPVVLNILKHYFASEDDVNDRIYMTSREIVENNLQEFTAFAGRMGELSSARVFPFHIEVRRRKDGILLPIEVNPMRFGGWCTTADTCIHGLGLNPYQYYFEQRKPDWENVLKEKDALYSLIVLDNSTSYTGDQILSFDYEGVAARFHKVFELRKADFRKFPLFGFLFVETQKSDTQELTYILNSDLREFVTVR